MSVDIYLNRTFDRSKYNCLDFVREVWLDLKGIDLAIPLQAVFGPPAVRTPTRKMFREFQKISTPQSPCLVLMERPHAAPHIGIFIRGRVLHLSELGVEFQPIDVASRAFTSVRYYV